MENNFIITDAENGWRLDKILTEKFPTTTRSQWQKRIKQGEVLLIKKPLPSTILSNPTTKSALALR